MLKFIRSNKYAFAVLMVFVIISGASGAVLVLGSTRPPPPPRGATGGLPSSADTMDSTEDGQPHPTLPLEKDMGLPEQPPLNILPLRYGRGELHEGEVAGQPTFNEPLINNPPTTSTYTSVTTTENLTQIHAKLFINDKEYQIITNPDTSLYSVMDNLKQNNQITFSGRIFSGMGYFIEEINSVRNNTRDGTYWIYYINGEPAKIGVSNYIVKFNDIINWTYGTTNF